MRASDADRDAVVSDLSEHFQAGRLTTGEFDDRTGRALTARTWGELGELVADLPAARPAAPAATPTAGRPQPPSGRAAPALVGIAIAAVVLVHIVHGGWGLIWLLLPALLIARRVTCH
jgi:transposase InsO family protein